MRWIRRDCRDCGNHKDYKHKDHKEGNMHPKQEELESKLSQLCQDLDNHLEDEYGSRYAIHPNRMKRGTGSNPRFDGLFSTSLAFTLGYGSKTGRGYVLEVDIRTLDRVSPSERREIEDEAFSFVEGDLATRFPDRDLSIVRDGNLMKIVGDFSLGDAY